MERRTALRRLGGLAAGFACGLGAFGARRSSFAFAAASGESPVPTALRATSVLEVFLCGGVSHYESFYCVPEHGATNRTHFHLYADTPGFATELERCGLSGPVTEPFAEDSAGQIVHLGPFAAPLRARNDVLARTRVSVTAHALAPHEAAIPLALSGRALGNPALAGLGAHVQRYYLDTLGESLAPYSYALLTSSLAGLPIDNLKAVTATGLHPATARPLDICVDRAGDLTALLARSGVGGYRAQFDALVAGYTQRYAEELRFRGQGERLRAHPFDDYSAATRALGRVDDIRSVIDPVSIVGQPGQSCGESVAVNGVAMQLRLAAHLLTHPTRPARYVCVVDGGFIPAGNGGGAYDSHSENTVIQARNLTSTLATLLELVNLPGENTPGKLNLDETLIVLNTEFGRSPTAEGTTGRSHWPYGYVNTLIGGPIHTQGVVGSIGPDAIAIDWASPAETRIAALLALGIWPFSSAGFSVADVAAATTETEAAALVAARQLGLT